jgi:hypothetical protein
MKIILAFLRQLFNGMNYQEMTTEQRLALVRNQELTNL